MKIIVLIIPMVLKKINDVEMLPKNEPIVEKNSNLPSISDFFSEGMSSESRGIVWLARNTGTKKRRHAAKISEKK